VTLAALAVALVAAVVICPFARCATNVMMEVLTTVTEGRPNVEAEVKEDGCTYCDPIRGTNEADWRLGGDALSTSAALSVMM
jgi:hypothetical protein